MCIRLCVSTDHLAELLNGRDCSLGLGCDLRSAFLTSPLWFGASGPQNSLRVAKFYSKPLDLSLAISKTLSLGGIQTTSQVSSYSCDDCLWNIFWPGITVFPNQFCLEKRDAWALSKDYKAMKEAYWGSYCFKEGQVLLITAQQEPVSKSD